MRVEPVGLPNGSTLYIQSTDGGDTERPVGTRSAQQLATSMDSIRGLAILLYEELRELSPDDIEVEFGIGFTLESGKLLTILADAKGSANVSVKLKWSRESMNS